jgi:hypothetical protein
VLMQAVVLMEVASGAERIQEEVKRHWPKGIPSALCSLLSAFCSLLSALCPLLTCLAWQNTT